MNYILDFRFSNSGGPVVPGRIVQFNQATGPLGSEDDLRLESKVVFLVHGYNVTRQVGRTSLLALADNLTSHGAGAYVVVLWPGDSTLLGFASYPLEGRDADDSAAELVRFIDRVIRPTAELSFVSHSLGARVVMETTKRLRGRSYRIGQICLMAAGVDDFSLSAPASYQSATQLAARVAVLASERDVVLRYGYPAGDFLEQFLFADQITSQALGLRGPKPFKGQAVPAQVFHVQIPWGDEVGHSDYLPNAHATPEQLKKQSAAVDFASKVLNGIDRPNYG